MSIKKTVVISLHFILATSLIMYVFGLVTKRGFDLATIYNANFFIGSFIIGVGIIVMFMPTRFVKFDKLTDHSTFAQRYAELREVKQEKAYGFIFLGILMIIITGLIQIALRALVPTL